MKNVLITGASAGIGLETARQLAALTDPHGQPQYKIFLACRYQAKAKIAIDSIIATSTKEPQPSLEFIQLELSDLESVRSCAREFLEKDIPLHVLVLNAGLAVHGKTAQGYEMMFGVNHLGHFLLTKLLLPRIKQAAPSRIVVVASNAHHGLKGKVVEIEKSADAVYAGTAAGFHGYSISKLFNIWFTHELARQLEGSGVAVNALHPGVVRTDIFNSLPWIFRALMWPAVQLFFLSPEAGARTSVYLASSPDVEGVTGKYFDKCKQVTLLKYVTDEESEKKLWEFSEKLVSSYLL